MKLIYLNSNILSLIFSYLSTLDGFRLFRKMPGLYLKYWDFFEKDFMFVVSRVEDDRYLGRKEKRPLSNVMKRPISICIKFSQTRKIIKKFCLEEYKVREDRYFPKIIMEKMIFCTNLKNQSNNKAITLGNIKTQIRHFVEWGIWEDTAIFKIDLIRIYNDIGHDTESDSESDSESDDDSWY